jgi:caffeoyl-CoA O-methyltransferase
MNRTLRAFAIVLLLAGVVPAQRGPRGGGPRGTAPNGDSHPPIAKSDAEKRILDTIEAAVRANELYANVPAADGRMLRLLTESVNARTVVEIGTSTGISGLWFAMALDKTGGRLNTFEIDKDRAAIAAEHFRKAGVERLVRIVLGDAHENVRKLKEPVDVVFIDAEKDGYVDYLHAVLPLVRPGGLILAHNVEMVPEYVKAVTATPDLETVFFMQGGGLAISLKKR